ncbi:MAG: hypothetical protein ACE367_19640 [Acidimicrobiales bacterium]
MAEVLYLVKANRVQEYHHQNLAILAAPEGERFEISYGERWVAPGLEVKPGQGCALVIADSPYRHYQPLRWGVVEEADVADRRLRLTVRMGAFVLDGERLTVEWDAAAQIDAERGDGEKTRPYFAFMESNHGLRNPHGRDEQDAAWHQAVEGLKRNEYFSGCSIARLGEITRADGVAVEAGRALPVGTEVRIPIEVRSIEREETELEVVVDAEPPGSLELVAATTVPANGRGEVRAVVTAPGAVRARLNLLPDALRSSRPVVAFSVVEAPGGSDAEQQAGASVDGVRRLVRRLHREATIADEDWIALFQDFFVPWGGGDAEVTAAYAERLFAAGRFRELESVLVSVERRQPRADLLLLLASIHNGTAAEHTELLTRVDFEDAGHFELLLAALDAAPPGVVRPVVEPLYKSVLGDDRKLELIRRVLPIVSSDEFATTLAEELAYHDPEMGVGFMMSRWPDPATTYGPALEMLVDFGVRKNQLGPYVRQWLGAMAEAHRWRALLDRLPKARQALPGVDRPAALGALAADLLGSGDDAATKVGFELACEAAEEACRTGQLDTAGVLADLLQGNLRLSGGDERRLAAKELIETIGEALARSDELTDWRARQAQDRYSSVAPHCRNKVLHLVGGTADAWEATLAANLQLAKLERHEAEKHKSPTADWVDSVDPATDIVVILWERIGHALSGRVKDACRRRGVPCIEARSGERGLLEALETGLG